MSDREHIRLANIARREAAAALKRGELVKAPCSICQSPQSEMHHPDYGKPLEIIWVCRRHHGMLHRGPNWKPPTGRSRMRALWQHYYDKL